jgi:hypothetical protein
MTEPMIQDEINRIYAEENYSEFEFYMMNQIMAWRLGQEKKFESAKGLINAFWSERLD